MFLLTMEELYHIKKKGQKIFQTNVRFSIDKHLFYLYNTANEQMFYKRKGGLL